MDMIKNIIIKVEKLKNNLKYDEAEKIIESGIMSYSNDYRLYEELADINLYKWNIDKAWKAIDFALDINPESATWNYLKWFLLLSNDKVSDSVIYLERSNKHLWNNSEVLRNLWWAYTMLWNTNKGISILKRALTIAPWDKLITEDLAMALIWSWEVEKWNIILDRIENTL